MTRAAAVLLVVSCWLATVDAQPPSLEARLESYAAGRYDDALAQADLADLAPLESFYTTGVPAWIGVGPAAGRRGAAAAAFLLELMEARLTTDYQRFLPPMEAICARLRAEPARTTFEAAWFHASVALVGRARTQGPFTWSPGIPRPLPAHLDHALARFPGDPAFDLARIMARSWAADDEPDRNGDAGERRRGRRGLKDSQENMSLVLENALTDLQRLSPDPHVGGEAILRSGQLQLARGRLSEALQAFDQARQRTTTPQIRYLTFFLAGRALTMLQRPDEAQRAYLQALDVWPHAESASIALAALQVGHGNPSAAAAAIDRSFSAPSAADPGRLIGYGDYMHWSLWRDAMRAVLRK